VKSPDGSPASSRAGQSGELDEAALLAGLRAGEDAAYEALLRTYSGRMLSVARRFMASDDDAQEAVQEAFVSAFKAMDRFEGDSRISTWLHRIVVNACLMKLRTRRRKPEESIDDLLPHFAENGHLAVSEAGWDSADHLLEKHETRGLVREAIERLPDTYRTVLLLRDIEEFDTEQTAEALKLTKAAVKTRLHRARQALRQLLDEHFSQSGDDGGEASI
jgi:RNA polymerase sigma-70 factor (ECF subfamily)